MMVVDEPKPPLLEIEGRVATITLRRPAVGNRLEIEDLETLLEQVAQVNVSDALVLRLRSTGKYFCTGFNIGSIGTGKRVGFEEVAAAIESCRAVTIAVLQGGVYGGATDLALACDFRVGGTSVDMFIPAAKLGLLFYSGGLRRFVSRLGIDTAKRIFLRASRLDASAMLACGFLTELVEQEQLDKQVSSLSQELAGMAPLPLLAMKKHLDRIATGTLEMQDFERDAARIAASQDLKEGALAWKERRAPRFTGQ